MERNAAFKVRMGEVNCYSGKFTSSQLISIKFHIIHSKSVFSECRRSIRKIGERYKIGAQ